jgi:DDE superfamily endonuclease
MYYGEATARWQAKSSLLERLGCSCAFWGPLVLSAVAVRDGAWDAREDNGQTKLDEPYLQTLYRIVRATPQQYGWRRPTWTRELLVEALVREIGVRVHVTTMSRALALVEARRGRPRPTVGCPWPKAAKTRRLNAIRRLLATWPRGHVAVYEDEVDIHLNPKLGLDWMVRGQQKEVRTPGQNAKRYLAGALDVRSGQLHWVEGERKTSALFILLLTKLAATYAQAPVIHVILDNIGFTIARSLRRPWPASAAGLNCTFCPPTVPTTTKSSVSGKTYTNVTRNHTCATIAELMGEVRYYLRKRNRKMGTKDRRSARSKRSAA